MSETFRAQVDDQGRVKYSRGIAKQYEISAGSAIRIELVEIADEQGRTRERPGEIFIADLEPDSPRRFTLPGELREQYDITGEDVVNLKLHQQITDEGAETIGGECTVTPPSGEPIFSRVSSPGRRVSFAEGFSRLHNLESGDSVRVALTEVTMPWGETIYENVGETFVADLPEYDETCFDLPAGLCKQYKIRPDGFVRLRLRGVIKDGRVLPIPEDRGPVDEDAETDSGPGIDVIRTRRSPSKTRNEDASRRRNTPETTEPARSSASNSRSSTDSPSATNTGNKSDAAGEAERSSGSPTDFAGVPDLSLGTTNSSSGKRDQTGTSNRSNSPQSEFDSTSSYVPTHETRELLEAIVADAFASLDYETEANCRKRTADGNTVKEVDVWAEKPSTPFSAYVSCKNHADEVGTPTVDREAGRVAALQQTPHLRVVVAPSFNDNARRALENRGFVGIETGAKAEMQNAEEVYRHVRKQLAELSLSLAPPRIQELAERVDEVSSELSSLSGELRDLDSDHHKSRGHQKKLN